MGVFKGADKLPRAEKKSAQLWGHIRGAVRVLVLPAALACAAGCTPLVDLGASQGPAPTLFDLQLPASSSVRQPSSLGVVGGGAQSNVQTVILIEEPYTGGAISTDRMAVVTRSGQVRYLTGARWSDRPARLVRQALRTRMSDVGGITALGRAGIDIPADYRLKVEVRRFGLTEQDGLAADIAIDVWMIDGQSALVDAASFAGRQSISAAEPSQAVDALSQVLADVSGQVVDWTRATITLVPRS